MALYDVIGKGYSQTRRRDPQITATLLEILAPSQASVVIDIGAGTGSYAIALAEQGYQVLAVEPSATMRSQAIAHPSVHWSDAVAETLPLPDGVADAAIMMLAFHHFSDPQQALREIARVTGNGPIILFTYDPEKITDFWLTQYFPSFVADVESTFLPISTLISTLQSITGNQVRVQTFPLPHNLSDAFAAVGWARPGMYLDSRTRNGISSFAKIDKTELNQGLSRLQKDLETGRWNQAYGYLRQQSRYDVGYCFIYTDVTSAIAI
ncbi:class I SAM-dependent methyltransferase [Trichocoleus sp. FACHB-591]|uniref:class I SAM-dependent methyltransferase n=1 Tax=Trichocoleus sp. FACHB-591 TaxID=2692872 RepID=UPI00168960E7|nr:class I SAM-dependent methyltransferase [Trichocoleus sp. FACHB-591]MBD2096999.1 class I SAM-dependent methyltransferase [Trichocoleus sp. FACHB-591]